ncbi:Transmembrane protein [Halotydeus destructor]|nr:Transmembrane protein [Halotydeus destructor]
MVSEQFAILGLLSFLSFSHLVSVNKSSYSTLQSNSVNSTPLAHSRYLALLDAAHSPVSVRASLGPMSVRETLYPMNYEPDSENAFDELFKANASHRSEWLDSPTPAQLTVASWQLKDTLSAHLVTTEVKRSSPVVRVLFYAGHRSASGHGRLAPASVDSSAICAVISVVSDSGQDKVFAACSPTNSRDGACVAELVVPATWWPALDVDGTPKRRKPSMVKVNYIVVQGPKAATCGPESGQQGRQQSSERIVSWLTTATRPQLPSDPLGVTWLGHVALVPYEGSYEEITNDDIVRILVPQEPVFVMSKVYVSVCFRRNPGYPVAAFSVRVRVKSGLRVVGAQLSKDTPWQISTEISGKQSMATITAYLRDSEYLQQDGVSPSKAQGKHHGAKAKNGQPSQEVFVLLMEIDESAIDMTDSGRVVWQVVYTTDNVGPGAEKMGNNGDRDGAKLTSRFNIQKDEVESLVGVTRKTQILNTAVLSGRQVAQQLRVFVVSRSGKPGDVTLQATCHSQDESILKVSHSCTSVYVDGSEIRGSTNATILVKYGAVVKAATFVVWMPKLPIEIRVSDDKLSQIKSWKTPHLTRRSHGNGVMADSAHRRPRHPTQSHEAHHDSDLGCRLRYQQAYVELTTNFYSVDHDSGREESLLSRRVFFQVTDLGLAFLRLTDPRVALLRGNVIEGLSPGRTELQLVSPITGKVIGSKELKVTLDKEAITQLEVDLVSGITLNLEPDDSGGRIWQVRASTINKMASLYQEGLLDARIHFSDGSVTALADVTESDFHLSVDIFESGMIAYAPKSGLAYPRVLAIGQGSGQLIHVSLEVAPQCQKKRTQQLAMTHVAVNVDFTSTQPPTTSVQNDAYHLRKYNGSRGTFDRNAKRGRETGASLRDKLKRSRTSQSDADSGVQAHHRHGMTPLQVGMYALLAVFSLAVFIFVASCMVFAVRLRGKPPSGADTPVVTAVRLLPQSPVICHANQPKKVRLLPNATDRNWVWLDRATLDVSRPIPVPTRHRIDLERKPGTRGSGPTSCDQKNRTGRK